MSIFEQDGSSEALLSQPASSGDPKATESSSPSCWRALGFKLDDAQLAIPIEQVSELATCTSFTSVPFVKAWVKGVTNVRGGLLTIVDLSNFLGKAPVQLKRGSRLIVVNSQGLQAALLTNEVLGLRQFEEPSATASITEFDEALRPFLTRAISVDSVQWGVFDLNRLSADDDFRHIRADAHG